MNGLRAFVIAAGALSLAGGVALLVRVPRGWPSGVEAIAFGALVLLSLRFERRYRNASRTARPGFSPTGERFLDPVSGRTVEVDEDPATGERVYRNG